MHILALLILEALDGDGLVSYGCIVWSSTYHWILSSSQFVMPWVEKHGISYLIERLVKLGFVIHLLRNVPWLEMSLYAFFFLFFFFFQQTAFSTKKDYGKEDREAKWILSQRSLQGLMATDQDFNGRRSTLIAEQARRRAEIARYSFRL